MVWCRPANSFCFSNSDWESLRETRLSCICRESHNCCSSSRFSCRKAMLICKSSRSR